MATSLGRLVLDLAANAAGFERDMQRVSSSTKKEMNKVQRQLRFAQRDLDQARAKVNKLAGAFAAVGTASLAIAGREIRNFAREADKLDKTSKVVGVAVEQLQELRFAAQQAAGVDARTFDLGLQRFARRVGEARNESGELLNTINRLGIEIEDSNGNLKNQVQLLDVFAKAINDAETGQEALSVAFKLFDSEAAKLVNLLRLGSDGITELREQFRQTGAVISKETVEATVRFNDSLNLLSANIAGIRNQVLAGLIESLADYAEFLARTEEGQEIFRQTLSDIADTAKIVAAAIGIGFVGALGRAVVGLLNAEVRVGVLTSKMTALTGASTAAATRLAFLGRALSIATGPIGIAVAAIGTLGAAFLSTKNRMDDATEAFKNFQNEARKARTTDAEEDRIRGLSAEQIEQEIEGLQRTIRTIESQSGSPEIISDIRAQIERLRGALESLNDEQPETQRQFEGTAASAGDLVSALNEFANEAAQDAIKRAGEVAESMKDMDDEIADVAARLGGPLAEAARDFQREAQRIGTAFREGDISAEQAATRLDLLQQEMEQTGATIRDELLASLPLAVQQMLGLADATQQAASASAAFSQIGSNFAQSIINGQGIQSALGSSLTAFGGQGIGDFLDQNLDQFFKTAFEDGVSAAFEDTDFQKNSAEGFALAIGQAVEGNIGQAAFTAAGNAIAGPIGAVIGSIIGDAIFGDSVPKFQVRGFDSNVDDAGTDRLVDGPLGRIEFAFRGIEDQAQSQIIRAFSEFDRSIAGVIRDEGQLEEVEAALDRFGVSSRSGPDNIEQQLELRFEAILSTFDSFTQGFVNQAITLDERVQRLNDLRQIGNLADLGRDFGLTFETLATVLDDVSIGGESLIDTFNRLEPAVLGLQRAADLTGNAFADSAEGLARFSADLLEVFGDDAGQFTGILNRVLGAAFSDAELDQQTIDAARQRATDLLTGLGISVSEDTFSQEGLRELIDNFLGNLGPEQTAILLEAGDAIATLIQAEQDLADERGDSIERLRDDFLQAIEDIRGVLDSQLLGTSSLTPRERLDLSQERLIEAAQAAQGGDLDAARDLPALFNDFINISARAFGTATDDFQRNEAFARELLGSLELGPDAIPVAEAQLDTLNSIQGLAQSQLAALESIRDAITDVPSFDTGGPIGFTGLANVDRGEFVVPQNGALVQRDDRVVARLESIEAKLGEGNSDRRQGVELQVERLESIVAAQEEEIRNLRLNSNKRPTGSESRANVIRQTRT